MKEEALQMFRQDEERPDLGAGAQGQYEDTEQKMETDGANSQGEHQGRNQKPRFRAFSS